MVNMTITISKETHTKMEKYKKINWNDIIIKAIEKKLKELNASKPTS